MSNLEEICISKICRSCLINTGTMKSLKDEYSYDMCIGEVLMSVTVLSSLEFFNDKDDLPKQMCLDCVEELTRAYRFVLKYRESEEKLLNYLENVTETSQIDNLENIDRSDSAILDVIHLVDSDHSIVEVDCVPETELTNLQSETSKVNESLVDETQVKCSKDTERGAYKYLCSVCGRSYQTLTSLTSHMRIHTGDKPYSCQICGKTFSQHSCMKQHMHTHSGKKQYQCFICNKFFLTKNTLSSHIRTHTGSKPYACHICNMLFSRKTHVNRHMRVHTGEKPHSCHLCNSAFVEKSHLNTHMRIHTGERPFSCTICDMSFNRKTTLSRHMMRHTNMKPYICALCDCAFIQKASLNLHMRKQHPNGSEPITKQIIN